MARSVVLSLIFTALVVLACEPPTSDADQPVRKLLTAGTWTSDPAAVPPDPIQLTLRFEPNGTLITAGSRKGSWSYLAGVLTLRGDVVSVTNGPTVTARTLILNYDGSTVHLYR